MEIHFALIKMTQVRGLIWCEAEREDLRTKYLNGIPEYLPPIRSPSVHFWNNTEAARALEAVALTFFLLLKFARAQAFICLPYKPNLARKVPKYWLITTFPDNFKVDKETTGFTVQGLKERHKKTAMKFQPGDKVVYYINRISKFGAIATITSGYYHDDKTRIWTDEDEIWPSRAKSKPDLVLEEGELLDIKRVIKDLTFVKDKQNWGLYVRGSVRRIPEEDYLLIESEMRKILSRRTYKKIGRITIGARELNEDDYKDFIMKLPLATQSLHDRIAEMLQTVGSWMGFNTNTRFRITPESAYQLDVAWLSGKNPEVAIEVQISGNIDSAIIKLREAREFNYRKVILVIEEEQISRLNAVLRFDHLRNWLDAWSIKSVYELYTNGQKFFELYDKLREARYRERKELNLI